jgi:hypothetical protein
MEGGHHGIRVSLRGAKVLGADGRHAWAAGWATGISKAYTELVRCTYMEGGLNGVRMSLRGGGGVQSPTEPMDAAWGLWVGQQASAERT